MERTKQEGINFLETKKTITEVDFIDPVSG